MLISNGYVSGDPEASRRATGLTRAGWSFMIIDIVYNMVITVDCLLQHLCPPAVRT
jgi:hypothetical protein